MRTARVAVPLVLFLLSCTLLRAGSTGLQISEAQFRATISEDKIGIAIPVHNSRAQAISGVLRLELLDPDDKVRAAGESEADFAPGDTPLSLSLENPAAKLRPGEAERVLWYRVRYRLRGGGSEQGGIVSLAAITPDLFQIQLAHPPKAREGQPYHLRVHAVNPVTRKPIAGVRVSAKLTFDEEMEGSKIKPVSLLRLTNAAGDAAIVFQVPKTTAEEGEIVVKAEKAGLTRDDTVNVGFDRRLQIITSTDKRLYQPGQALHVRALAFLNRHAFNDVSLRFTLYDPDGNIVLRGTEETNKFGIASLDWMLPGSLRLGDYKIRVTPSEGNEDDEHLGESLVRISRYELPNFSVSAKADRPYYLPGENAEVEVAADYLFGKPVNHGAVRVVRETDRRWNWEKQKWDVEEEESYPGELDGDGRCKLKIDLAALHKDFEEEKYYRFRDATFAAYVTDSSTKRTEQRRFKLRLTHEPIHIYLIRDREINGAAEFYLSTFYADGTAAQTRVEISQLSDDPAGNEIEMPLRTIKTNRYGLAKVTGLMLHDTGRYYERLSFTARDASGRTGKHADSLSKVPDFVLNVSSDKALYRIGEPILLEVRSGLQRGDLIIDLVHEGVPMRSHRTRLRHGRASLLFPFEPRFQGALTAVAYSLEKRPSAPGGYEYLTSGSHTVLYPHDTELKVKLNAKRTSYRPGEEFSAGVRVTAPDGSVQPTALGVVVVDKAVEERIRTDEEFGSQRVGFWDRSWWYDPTSFGGVSRADLDKLDMSEPLPAGMDLAAELILNSSGEDYEPQLEGYGYESQTYSLFHQRMLVQLAGVSDALRDPATEGWKFPVDDQQLAKLLRESGIDLTTINDAWGTPYRFSFGLDYRSRTIEVTSAGPDKTFGTLDDLGVSSYRWEYFSPMGRVIARAITDANDKQIGMPQDFASLREVVLPYGIDLSNLRDPWGNPYRFKFDLRGRYYIIQALSLGPVTQRNGRRDDFSIVWSGQVDYFSRTHERIDAALAANTRMTGRFPASEEELSAVLQKAGISLASLRDPWGNPYYVTFARGAAYKNAVVIQYSADKQMQNVNPVTMVLDWIYIHTLGKDGQRGTADDAVVASFAAPVSVQSGSDAKPQPVKPLATTGGTGAIRGTITDPSGAVIAGATVTAKREGDTQEHTTTTDNSGNYLLRGLEGGLYKVQVFASGFVQRVVENVPVQSQSVTVVSTTLSVGAMSQSVEVQAAPATIETTMSSVAASRPGLPAEGGSKPTFTPRLRQYFPETLFWAPSIITDGRGSAKLAFKLADSITTWKMAVVASSENGDIGTAETEIGAFQPFFVEHEPPRVLTIGDEIALPVIVRNYLERSQQVDVQLHPASWLALLGSEKQNVTVASGESSRMEFPFRATAMVRDAAQRITAANGSTGDAIEKPVTVHPDGREANSTATRVIGQAGNLDLELPRDLLPGSMAAELKLYPNPLAHVIEGIEAGLERPYGCGEQTISSTYPSLLVLKYYKEHGVSDAGVSQRAQKYLRAGYERLLNYRDESGGFTYWGHGEPDVALTAYAVRFLQDAQGLIKTDSDLIPDALHWLVGKQNADGSWNDGKKAGDPDPALTAYVARVLARVPQDRESDTQKAITNALKWLETGAMRSPDPYAVASFALAAAVSGNKAQAASATARLLAMVHHESERVYWALEANTPFYGWGTAGRVETTALALLALNAAKQPGDEQLMEAGLLFLLENKDEYGVWYSGQTTLNVLDALLAVMPPIDVAASTADIIVNGKPGPKLDIPAASRATGPIRSDISRLLSPGPNRIAIRMATPLRAAVQVVSTYYLPWTVPADVREQMQAGESRGLRLAVHYDKLQTQVGDEVRCSVSAERFGHRGYGMMLAEVGLSPGAEVDRASLDQALDQGVERYDILPDRIIVYLWPYAGGTKFDFKFRSRMGIKARTAPSLLFDYYNPEEQVVVPPADFKATPAKSLAAGMSN